MSNVRKITDAGPAGSGLEDASVYRHMVAATKAPMAFVDTGYVIRETNQSYLDMAGKERSEMVGHPVAKLVGERHFIDISKPDLDRCFAGESINAQRWAGYLAGGKRYVDVHFDPSRDEKGNVRGAVVSFRDITEQKQLQDALAQSEQQMRAIFDHSPSEIYLKDVAGRYVHISRKYEQRYDVKNAEVTGKLPHEVHYQELADISRTHDLAVLESGKTIAREERSLAPDDSDQSHTQLVLKFPIRDELGNVDGVGAIATDISERIRAEDALRESEARFRNLIDVSLQGVCIHRDGLPLFANQACADIFGYDSAEDIYAVETLDVLQAPYEQQRLKEYNQRRGEGGLAPSHYEFDGVRRDGSVITLITSDKVINWYGASAIQSSFVDISEKKAVEEALRRSRETLRAIIDAVPAMINAKDEDGRFIFMNEYQASVLGVNVREVVGKTMADVTSDSHGAYTDALDQQVLRSGREIPFFEEMLTGHDGIQRTCLSTLVPLPESGGGRRVATISLDITSRKEGEREREELIQELEARNAELERFSYTVSHDLKSPLITIRGFMGLLEQDILAGDRERISKDIEKVQEAAETMQKLLRDLLNLSRIGRIVGAMENVSLSDIAAEAIQRVSGLLSAFRLDVNVADDMPMVHGDRARLIEVLQNLLENAVKFRGDQTHPRVDVECQTESGQVVCYVRDNGVGIDSRYHEKVFGLFERLDQEVEGTGIGLALVRRIIEVHGGKIWVESQGAGSGSTFCFMLPVAEPPQG